MEHDSQLAIEWFESNCMKLNQDKCHLLVPGYNHENILAQNKIKIWESSKQKLWGVVVDRDLGFNKYVSFLSVKKLAGNYPFYQDYQIKWVFNKEDLMKSFVEAQFGYCPLVWMFNGREINRKINLVHERSLRIVCRNFNSCFKDLPKKDKFISIHHRIIQSLAVELFKVKENFPIQ